MNNKILLLATFALACYAGACEETEKLGSDCKAGLCLLASNPASHPCLVTQEGHELKPAAVSGTASKLACLSAPQITDSSGLVECTVSWRRATDQNPAGPKSCKGQPFLSAPADKTQVDICDVTQIKAPLTGAQPDADGWYYDDDVVGCPILDGHRPAIRFTERAQPADGVNLVVSCTHSATGAPDASVVEITSSQCVTLPNSSTHSVGNACLPDITPGGGYDDSEAYVQVGASGCETGACMVYHLKGDPSPTCSTRADADASTMAADTCADPAEVAARVYCTCRCDAPEGDPGPRCACPDGFACVPVLEGGAPQVRGSYCVRHAQQ